MGRLQLAATARTVDWNWAVLNLAMISRGCMRVKNKSKKNDGQLQPLVIASPRWLLWNCHSLRRALDCSNLIGVRENSCDLKDSEPMETGETGQSEKEAKLNPHFAEFGYHCGRVHCLLVA